ncbi:helix-turn-helix transcriptional regulator [Pseudomonas sp. LS-2]|uniref:helix-turn-helix transcriptional regulator n=1 Tax=Pseudomonas sp. LS-2 TaxID=2315859 RepID=UPI000E7163DC|nr:helix-turn-helix transcriptional regulator [Pseudomonas sp. LS-2]RJX81289.1 XRE family transcriptional regulator [Pseudomonas sp. LS-2]
MNTPIPTVPQLAAEAAFQLQACLDQLNWLTALACAIQLDHSHGRGKYAEHLAQVAAYLSDTGFAGVHSAIEEFNSLSESAPRNAEVLNRGAVGEGETLAQRIIWSRERASLSQDALARLIDVKQGTLSYLESGKTKRSACIPDIARACKVDIEWLAFGLEGAQ